MQEELQTNFKDVIILKHKMFDYKMAKREPIKALSLTILMERESFFTILTERDRFLLNSNGGGASSPSITPLTFCA